MCGIVGFTGRENALPILIKGLYSLEYRGYDSAGVAAFTKDGLRVIKARGRIANLEEKIKEEGGDMYCTCGIGHTRWATHGEPSDRNSHPHLGGKGKVAVVHNGIIENYKELRERLEAHGDCRAPRGLSAHRQAGGSGKDRSAGRAASARLLRTGRSFDG